MLHVTVGGQGVGPWQGGLYKCEMFTKTHCQLRWKWVGSEVQPRPGSGAEPELVKICVKCKQADAASSTAGECVFVCAFMSVSVCVFASVCCGINPFTGVWPESTGVNADAGAASRKTFVTFALRAAPSGNAPAACYAGGLLCVHPFTPLPTSSWAVQFICTLHLPINSYLSSHAGLLLGDCINQCGPSDNSYTSAIVSVGEEVGVGLRVQYHRVVMSEALLSLSLFIQNTSWLCSASTAGRDEPRLRYVKSAAHSISWCQMFTHRHSHTRIHIHRHIRSDRYIWEQLKAPAYCLHWVSSIPNVARRTNVCLELNCIPF